MPTTMIAMLLAGTVQTAPASPGARVGSACGLLTVQEVHAAQGVAVKERKPSGDNVRGMHFDQCVFATTDFAHSVSLTVITGAASTRADAVNYWQKTFEGSRAVVAGPAEASKPKKKERVARRVTGPGEQAFWTGDDRAGALYVLSGPAVLRISVGGAANEQERIERSATLAEAALKRLNKDS